MQYYDAYDPELGPKVRDASHSQAAKYTAEFLGTFFLVLTVGCNVHTHSIAAALSIGSVLMAMVSAFGSVSGGHFNPAVTIAVLFSGRDKIHGAHACAYIMFQVLGGLSAGVLYRALFHDAFILAPPGAYSVGQAAALEIFYTAALCYVVLNVATSTKTPQTSPNGFFGLAIGFTVVSAAVAIGPVSGCSLNPAVSCGAILASYLQYGDAALIHYPKYIFAPFAGALLGTILFWTVRGGFSETMEYAHTKPDYSPPPSPPPSPLPVRAWSPPVRRPASPEVNREGLPVMSHRGSVPLRRRNSILFNEIYAEHQMICGLRWHVQQTKGYDKPVDVDVSCLKFGRKRGEVHPTYIGAVYFTEQSDEKNQIFHSGDEMGGFSARSGARDGEDCESISFQVGKLQRQVQVLLLTASIWSSNVKGFQDVNRFSVHVHNKALDAELCHYDKRDFGQGNALIVAMIYRRGSKWAFKAIDDTIEVEAHTTARMLAENHLLDRYIQEANEEHRLALSLEEMSRP